MNTKMRKSAPYSIKSKAKSALLNCKMDCESLHWVFEGEENQPLKDFKKAWNALLMNARINGFRFHDFRHHFASKFVMAGVDLNTTRELLGHGSLDIALRYAHLAPEHKAMVVNLI